MNVEKSIDHLYCNDWRYFDGGEALAFGLSRIISSSSSSICEISCSIGYYSEISVKSYFSFSFSFSSLSLSIN
jgi:hypothetical protein